MSQSNRIVIWKLCKRHKNADGPTMERVCGDCRRAIFRASMKARGITVSTPTYKGPWCSQKGEGSFRPGLREPAVFARPLAELFTSRQRA